MIQLTFLYHVELTLHTVHIQFHEETTRCTTVEQGCHYFFVVGPKRQKLVPIRGGSNENFVPCSYIHVPFAKNKNILLKMHGIKCKEWQYFYFGTKHQ